MNSCPADFYGYNGQGNCFTIDNCPGGTFGYEPTHSCITKTDCNDVGIGGFIYEKYCILDCSKTTNPVSTYFYLGDCLSTCPESYYGYND